jgi:hypothetical protein
MSQEGRTFYIGAICVHAQAENNGVLTEKTARYSLRFLFRVALGATRDLSGVDWNLCKTGLSVRGRSASLSPVRRA